MVMSRLGFCGLLRIASNYLVEPERLQAIAWLGDTSQHGVGRVMDICRACSTTLDVDAGQAQNRVSFQARLLGKFQIRMRQTRCTSLRCCSNT